MRESMRGHGLAAFGCLVFVWGCSGGGPSYPRIPEADAASMRQACTFSRGAMPWETIGKEYPIGDAIPIDHIVMLMQENRSFDSYFGTMPGVEGIPPGASNPDAMGNPVAPFHATQYCIDDVDHSWDASHLQYDGGANDGFVTTNDPNGQRAMGYLTDADLPFYWDLYSTFAMSDHHHASVLGPTYVNRYYYMAGTSFGLTTNIAPVPAANFQAQSPAFILQELDDAGIEWRIYADLPFVLLGFSSYVPAHASQIHTNADFFTDAAAGTLPPVSYVDPHFLGGVTQTDEHPPADPQFGQDFVYQVVQAVLQSPDWDRTALIITYDEHGGFYDHVPPPAACPPGDFPPDLSSVTVAADFDREGFRVPLVVVSPYAKAGYVSDHVTDGASILRFVETRFLLPALTGRDANAWPLLDMFDFGNPPFVTAPSFTEPPIDQTQLAECQMNFP